MDGRLPMSDLLLNPIPPTVPDRATDKLIVAPGLERIVG
jgi:hypothetical protein